MHSTLIGLFAVAGLTSLVAAAPAPVSAPNAAVARDTTCSVYPWFLVPFVNTQDCTDAPATYQPTSGPISASPQNVYCRSLADANSQGTTFGSVAVNPNACPQQPWQIRLYTDDACTSQPTIVQSNQCVAAPGLFPGYRFAKFDALLLPS